MGGRHNRPPIIPSLIDRELVVPFQRRMFQSPERTGLPEPTPKKEFPARLGIDVEVLEVRTADRDLTGLLVRELDADVVLEAFDVVVTVDVSATPSE